MIPRSCASAIVLLLWIAVPSAADVPSFDEDSARAAALRTTLEATRDRARQDLAETRRAITEGRVAITEELRRAHEELADARRSIEQALTREAEVLARLERTRARADSANKRLDDRVARTGLLHDGNATTDPRSPIGDRIAGLESVLRDRLDRLAADLAVSAETGPIVDRDGNLDETFVVRLGRARAIALGTTRATRGFLTTATSQAPARVDGEPLPDVARNEIARLDPGDIPETITLDVDGSLVRQRPAPATSFATWFRSGRVFMWPIVGVLVFGILLIVERTVTIGRLGTSPDRWYALAPAVEAGDVDRAARDLPRRSPVDRIVDVGIRTIREPRGLREAALDRALAAEAPSFTRGLPILQVLAAIAPLLGLLGTVTGMIAMFASIRAQGLGDVGHLSGGISEALVTTQAGMIVAIPLVLAHAILARWSDRKLLALEETTSAILAVEGGAS